MAQNLVVEACWPILSYNTHFTSSITQPTRENETLEGAN
jgi:hypothetical protein